MTTDLPGLSIIKPGFMTSLQDSGRRGVMHQGLACGGPMDRHAWAWANRLVGNPWHTAALEISFGGFECMAETHLQIAITGADTSLHINGSPQPHWTALNINPGDRLVLGHPASGVRIYLAVQGGFALNPGLGGSNSTLVREGTGGLQGDGSALQAGDHLPCNPVKSRGIQRQIPEQWLPDYTAPLVLDVIMGAQLDRFPSSTLHRFFSSCYTLTPRSDRMGARLSGPALEHHGLTLISEGISLGAIQVPADGQPIILLQDRQTVGGYPKLGAVTPRSLDALAQRMPGSEIRFRPIALHEAQEQEKRFLAFFQSQ
jgi:biotin-dependent carboxylase-like uncharacterized protein